MKIGLVGTGLMGMAMAERLRAVAVPLIVYNRTPEKLAPLQQAGVEVAASVAELVEAATVILVVLSDAAAIRSVLLTNEVRSKLSDRTVIQMGTIGPRESQQIAADITAVGGSYLEAPVLGSIPEAKTGKLLVMVGATAAQFEQWRSVLQHLGAEPLWVGQVGTAAAMKLGLNQLIGSLTTAFGLSLALIQQEGVAIEQFMQVLRQSALYAPTFDKKLQRMVEGQYDNPNFPTKHLLKDTRLFLDAAQAHGLAIDSLDGVRRILEAACEQGLADADYSALYAALRPVQD